LIRRCLRIAPSRRPTPQELYDATETQLRSRAAGAKDHATGLKNGKRVYYMGNEINDMPANGDIPAGGGGTTCEYIPYNRHDFSMFNKRKFKDPDLESLHEGRWQPWMPPFNADDLEIVPGGRKKHCTREGYIFIRHKDFPSVLVREFGLASDFEEDDRNRWGDGDNGAGPGDGGVDGRGSGGGDDHHGSEDRADSGERRGGNWDGGKYRGAFREQTAAKGNDREQFVLKENRERENVKTRRKRRRGRRKK
jgi:hypothetical protein